MGTDTYCSRDINNVALSKPNLQRKIISQPLYTDANVLGVDMLRSRMFGNKVYIDLEICVDGNKSLWEAHEVAERVHKNVEQQFSIVKNAIA